MTPPPKKPTLSREAFPGLDASMDPVLQSIGEALGQLSVALDKGLTREENLAGGSKDGNFTTKPTVAETWPVRVRLPMRPRHVMARLQKHDGSALANAWSLTWKLNSSGEVELTFQCLEASARYDFSLLYE